MTVAILTCAAPPVFPAPANREATLADLEHSVTERRAEAVVWVANRGTMADQPLLLKRLRDESAFVRAYAEQGLWLLWSRSGDAAIDRQMARGVEEMQTGRLPEALATFSDVIRQRPAFAEGWNKRATAHYMAGDFKQSLADCDEVLKRNPNHFGAISGYGQIHFQMEDYEQALRWWRRALEVNPNMVGVETNIKMTEERLRQTRGRST
ncbi:MAG: tetratricopeptide repeat protein [Proteobacteria bacterium]|nr:tetratricopeptide repeat protein [Pseudomonadota bacterium]